ncbi:DinB family protein [Pelobium manganitolerans]|uniref:DinB family protein n=1 Tax=Pelobium manganitolerans TaxID=1842495 RepID=UPI003FA3B805
MEKLSKLLAKELELEGNTTRKMLSIVPNDKFDYKPHEKSMAMKNLATHLADIASWPEMILTTTELDFENNTHQIDEVNTALDLVKFFDKCLEKSLSALRQADDECLTEVWTLRSGAQIYSEDSKYETIRMSMAQQIHHRAQLGVYLRLLNIPIPGSYGPSADEMTM